MLEFERELREVHLFFGRDVVVFARAQDVVDVVNDALLENDVPVRWIPLSNVHVCSVIFVAK